MRFLLAAITVALLLTGCADDGMFTECPFDNTITQVCQTGTEGASLTCVVEKHPQCPEDICFSWRGSSPFCTRPCTENGGECPSGSQCVVYEEVSNKRFCVEDATLQR
jgi:hypothetical protein